MRIPGLGPRLLARALAAFGSEGALLAAVQAGDVDALAAAAGIGAERARRIVHRARGDDPDAFLATPRGRQLFQQVREAIAARAGTRAARNRILLIAPVAAADRRAERLAAALRGAARTEALDLARCRGLLARVAPLPAARPEFEADVLLLADTAADHEALRAAGLGRWAPIADLEDPRIVERLQGVPAVIHLTRGADAPDGAPVIPVPFATDPAVAAPWGTIARCTRARGALEAMRELAVLTGEESAAAAALATLDALPDARGAGDRLSASDAAALAHQLLEEELAAAESRLAALTVTGRDLVRALAAGEAAIPPAVANEYQEAARRAERRLETATGLAIDAYADGFPPQVDERAVRGAVSTAMDAAAVRRVAAELKAAQQLARLAPRIDEEHARLVALDWELAVGGFVREHGLVAPEWGDGLLVEGLLPLHLGADAERIDYRLGVDAGGAPDDIGATLLTGANSGGKTTLLEAVAVLVALAHAGLPVPARRAVVPELTGIHLYRARGERGAGALEALLLELFPLASAPGRRLILADELEAMTELDAAAEILAALLEAITARGHLAVLATHLAPHLMPAIEAATRARIRVDGIEASGLDADGRLVVARSPRLGVIAQSTPELILKRLASRGPAELQPVFAQLADRVASRRSRRGAPE